MRRMIVVGIAAMVLAGTAAATEQADVMKTVHQFVDSFNKGDVPTGLAACASPAFILDEFPPYVWAGNNAGRCARFSQRLLQSRPGATLAAGGES